MSDATGLYSVWQWLEDDWHECVGSYLDAEEAVRIAHSYTARPAALMGAVRKVSIAALEDDTTAFL